METEQYRSPTDTIKAANVAEAVQLVELVERLQDPEYAASEYDRHLASRFMGWGSVHQGLDIRHGSAGDTQAGESLRAKLEANNWRLDAISATETSHFTDPVMVTEIWRLLANLGFDGGRVLEPSSGTGNFIVGAPDHLEINATCIEMELVTASLAKLRMPKANVINNDLQSVYLRDESFDLVIGNVPFSKNVPYDPQAPLRFNTHNYFFWRSLKAVRAGGLVALITSMGTMDANEKHRAALSKVGQLVGALRLPSGAHKTAKTQVGTDLLIFRRPVEKKFEQLEKWADTTPVPMGMRTFALNEYFAAHPDHVLGDFEVGSTMYGDDNFKVVPRGNFEREFARAIDRISEQASDHGVKYTPETKLPPLDDLSSVIIQTDDGLLEKGFYIDSGELRQILNGQLSPVSNIGADTRAELIALVGLREALGEIWEAEANYDNTSAELDPLRNKLNNRYDAYVDRFGYLSRRQAAELEEPDDDFDDLTKEELVERKEQMATLTASRKRHPGLQKFRQDPLYPSVMALEMWNAKDQKGEKADIFKQRVNVPVQAKTTADSPGEALAICLDQVHEVNLELIASLLSKDVEQIPELLGDLLFEDPQTEKWVSSSEYLSGNVRVKLTQAQAAAEEDSNRYARNVEALTPVIPVDLEPEDIVGLLGANWIAPDDIEDFCRSLVPAGASVTFEPVSAMWHVEGHGSYMNEAKLVWGTSHRDAYQLINSAMNNAPVKVTTKNDEGKVVVLVEETLAAEAKLEAIKARFKEWIWEDPARTRRLTRVYNDLHNASVPRRYDGSHLTFPGMTADITLRDYQQNAIWRMVTSSSALIDHPVGFGKTFTMVAGIMTLRRFGLCQTAVLTTPNQLLHQITGDAIRLYPTAKVLMATKEDLATAENRKLFAARIATGSWDMVIMTHSAFKRLPVHPSTEVSYIEKQLAEFEAGIATATANGDGDSPTTKQLGKRLNTMRERQKKLIDSSSDSGAYFEQTGINVIFADEFHFFKNLGLATAIEGFSMAASQRASDMHMKMEMLRDRSPVNRAGYGFTGTPLTNSLSEVFVMEKYFNPDGLRERGVEQFMAWVNNFANIETRFEVGVDGRTFKAKRRPYEFHNMPDLSLAWAGFADSLPPDLLDDIKPNEHKLKLVLEPSFELETYVEWLVKRMEALERRAPMEFEGKEDNMLWISGDGRAAAVDPSLRGLEGPHLKIEAIAQHQARLWRVGRPDVVYAPDEAPNLSFGFCDLGTPKKGDDQLYGLWRDLLVEQGVPRRMIRFIHDAKTDADRANLFEQARNGTIAFLLGSTEKMGTGMNAQTRALSLFAVDAPWRMDGVEQRIGRPIRQGNTFPHVLTANTVISGTFDSFIWQTLERKARIVSQFRLGKGGPRSVQDIDDATMTVSELKAAATGDPLLVAKSQLVPLRSRLSAGYIGHQRSVRDAQNRLDSLEIEAHDQQRRSDLLEEVQNELPGNMSFEAMGGRRLESNVEIGKFFHQESIKLAVKAQKGTIWVGRWAGCQVAIDMMKSDGHPSFWVTLWRGNYEVLSIKFPPSSRDDKRSHQIPEAVLEKLEQIPATILRMRAKAESCREAAAATVGLTKIEFAESEELKSIDKAMALINEVIALEAGASSGRAPAQSPESAEVQGADSDKSDEESAPKSPEQQADLDRAEAAVKRKEVSRILAVLLGKDDLSDGKEAQADEETPEQQVERFIAEHYVEIPFDREEYDRVVAEKQAVAFAAVQKELQEAEERAAARGERKRKPTQRKTRSPISSPPEQIEEAEANEPLGTSFESVDPKDIEEMSLFEVAPVEAEIAAAVEFAESVGGELEVEPIEGEIVEDIDVDEDLRTQIEELIIQREREDEEFEEMMTAAWQQDDTTEDALFPEPSRADVVAKKIRSSRRRRVPEGGFGAMTFLEDEVETQMWRSDRRIAARPKAILQNFDVPNERYAVLVVDLGGKVIDNAPDTDRATAFDQDLPRLKNEYKDSGLSIVLLGRHEDRRVIRRDDFNHSIVVVARDHEVPYAPKISIAREAKQTVKESPSITSEPKTSESTSTLF